MAQREPFPTTPVYGEPEVSHPPIAARHPVLAAHKQAIARAFGRAAKQYDQFAALQRESGEQVMALMGEHPGLAVLDAGCGTGYFSARWQQQGKRVTALDLSGEMLAIAQTRGVACEYLHGDIEQLPLPDGCMDLCFSNMVMQWCDDFARAVDELYRVTRPGGVIGLCTLAQGTLAELDCAWQQVDGSQRINPFLPAQAIMAVCQRYRAQVMLQPVTCYFPDVLSLMRSVKGVGASWLRAGRAPGSLSRRQLAALGARYVRHSQGYPLTYQRVFGVIYRD
ncbi:MULTISPECIES: malonyl-ACP O-methyltransferase BioC [Dickeya]|uniref:Malonyl-[acyl-carrier protein] O-methyltransferase n=1 Tax=Dickeya aquatica TaxID=1401087 RepID=A0A375A950_9GAMM|nr:MULTISPECIES: malonyl-ACP O-methyltransferase BioC [Dickeya]SLM62573.1 SAM-dependent methyltransferase [Dickeya aquatica]